MRVRYDDRIHAGPEVLGPLIAEGFHGIDTSGVEVHVRPARNSHQSFCGRAYAGRPARARLDPETVYLVVLFLPRHLRNRAYPKTYRYPRLKTAPLITVDDWRERLVALAGHEACHIRQFRERLRCSEVEAERWALRALERYRGRTEAPEDTTSGPTQLSLFEPGALHNAA